MTASTAASRHGGVVGMLRLAAQVGRDLRRERRVAAEKRPEICDVPCPRIVTRPRPRAHFGRERRDMSGLLHQRVDRLHELADVAGLAQAPRVHRRPATPAPASSGVNDGDST